MTFIFNIKFKPIQFLLSIFKQGRSGYNPHECAFNPPKAENCTISIKKFPDTSVSGSWLGVKTPANIDLWARKDSDLQPNVTAHTSPQYRSQKKFDRQQASRLSIAIICPGEIFFSFVLYALILNLSFV